MQGAQEDRLFPRDPADTQPTAFGNVLAATADYPFSILEQLREEAPGDLESERALWARLAARLRDLDAPLAVRWEDGRKQCNAHWSGRPWWEM